MLRDSVRIRRAVLQAIEAHARAVAPAECCGLLIGRPGRIDEAVPASNLAADPARRYEIDPRDYLAALKRTRGSDEAVVGAYHSHPRSAPAPSPTDRDLAFSDFLYLIGGPVTGPQPFTVRAFRLENGNFGPVRLVLNAEEPSGE